MSLPVVLTAQAEADLDEAAEWYEQRSVGLGIKLVAQARAVFSRIWDNPNLYSEVHERSRRASVRRLRYGVFYRPRDDRIEVIAVFHDRRDPSGWQRHA